MKIFKKIGLGIISLGLISTFYIPEAKANETIVEFDVNGTTWAIKLVTRSSLDTGKFLVKKVGSGSTSCKKWVYSPSTLLQFQTCVAAKIGVVPDDKIFALIKSELGL